MTKGGQDVLTAAHVSIVVILSFLWVIAAIAFSLVGAYLVVGVMRAALTPVLTRAFPETPWTERSDKAKEKFADSLLSVSNTVLGATCIAVLVVRFTAILRAVVTQRDLWAMLSPFLKSGGLSRWQPVLLTVLLLLPMAAGVEFRKRAMDIYDEIAKPAIPCLPLAPGAHHPRRAPVKHPRTR